MLQHSCSVLSRAQTQRGIQQWKWPRSLALFQIPSQNIFISLFKKICVLEGGGRARRPGVLGVSMHVSVCMCECECVCVYVCLSVCVLALTVRVLESFSQKACCLAALHCCSACFCVFLCDWTEQTSYGDSLRMQRGQRISLLNLIHLSASRRESFRC